VSIFNFVVFQLFNCVLKQIACSVLLFVGTGFVRSDVRSDEVKLVTNKFRVTCIQSKVYQLP
jgi:hypothetical protein